LPRDFAPDCGISFDGRKDDEWNKDKTWPIGTNLFTANQAEAMFKHCLAALAQRDGIARDDARDAARYRWLHQFDSWSWSMPPMRAISFSWHIRCDKADIDAVIDAAIDAAITSESGEQKSGEESDATCDPSA
jgi:hypothetical protein